MKNTKQCPKCGSTDIIVFMNDGYPEGAHHGIMTGITIMSTVPLHRYICCNCGYTEQWVNRSNIEKLKQCKKAKPVNE
ncbi:MAG: hypothetical protein K5695_06535 [Oscillospiraceae bacterium]|nr:hypothetical protein [Oscillospiraceae bacterium]